MVGTNLPTRERQVYQATIRMFKALRFPLLRWVRVRRDDLKLLLDELDELRADQHVPRFRRIDD